MKKGIKRGNENENQNSLHKFLIQITLNVNGESNKIKRQGWNH